MNDDELENVDSSWIEEFETLDKEYKDYYTEDIAVIKIHFMYVNKQEEIERVFENKLILRTPGIISKEEILGLIKHNMICNEVKYSLLYILKFNINLEPIYLKTFIRNKEPLINIGNQFIQSIKNIDEIKLEKSISMFHDLNDLLIIFHDKTNLTNSSSTNISYHNKVKTKKIYLNSSSFKKTKRNVFKDNIV
jgi:hypothetical protein